MERVVSGTLGNASTPVTTSTNATSTIDNMENQGVNSNNEETSSISTPSTSDIESATSTHSEDGKVGPSKIKDLIKNFEHIKSKTLPNMENRVDKLGRQLRDTIELSFDSNEAGGSSSDRSSAERETVDAMVGKFETYVRTIKMFSKSRRKCDGKHLFDSCLLVGLSGKAPYIKFQFPQDVEVPYKIEELCFPDSADASIDCSTKAQNYSILITNYSGERIYGYCRRVLPENSSTCLPLAYCILSKHRAARFYRRILQELESRHGLPDKMRDVLLNEFYYHKFPHPGETIRVNLKEINKFISDSTLLDSKPADCANKENIKENNAECRKSNDSDLDLNTFVLVDGKTGEYGTLNIDQGKYNKRNGVIFHNGIIPKDLANDFNEQLTSLSTPTELILTLHEDSRYKDKDLEELCSTLNIQILQKVFSSILLERKVIFISCLLGKLSTCIEALQNMLYPFSWPHTLIPVVPKDLWEIVEAPTPVICGALSLCVVNDYIIDNAIVVDLDEGAILMEVGDECKILPQPLLKEFKDGMSLANNSSKENESGFNVLLSDSFLRIFIHSCGHYKNFIKDGIFLKEEFIQYPKRKAVKRFLKWFTETTMFGTFIDTVLADPNSFKVFDKSIQIYSSQDSTLILEKMKDWKKEKSNTLFF